MTRRAQLHLVNGEGVPVSTLIKEAVESAFEWVRRDFPGLDEARLADMAESLASSMDARGDGITSPRRFAYPALRGKVRDSLRRATNQEMPSGVSHDLERIGGRSGSFQRTVDRKILFDQLHEALSERDRVILTLILSEKPTRQVADELQTTAPAARKAVQRVKERLRVLLDGNRKAEYGRQNAVKQRGLAIE